MNTPAEHEFAPEHGARFADLSAWMRRTAGLLGVIAALFVALAALAARALYVAGPRGAFLGILAMAGLTVTFVAALTAWSLRGAARSVAAVAESAGRDVAHTMDAMRALRRIFRVLRAAAVAVAALVALAFIAHHGR